MNENAQNKAELKIISMDQVEEKEIDWLWYPFIPYAKVTIVQGDPGEGKTTFILQLAALLSKGKKLPCCDEESEPITVIYQTAEDGLDDTIKPRLVQADADCSKIKVIDESKEPLTMLDERIEQSIIATGARLVVLDPIQAYIGASVDMHRANEVRPIMNNLFGIAQKHNCAIVLIGHMNKAKGVKSAYRGLGSVDFLASVRSMLVVGRVKKEPDVRVIAQGKSNLAFESTSVAFRLSEENGFEWIGYYDIQVDDLLSGSSGENKTRKAQLLIFEMLENGAELQKVILDKAKDIGISKRVLDQAKKNLEVKSKRINNSWYWEL